MNQIARWVPAVFAALAAIFPSDVVYSQSASALVLERTGTSMPSVQAYSEIPVGTKISLSGEARLVFLHYFTCRTVGVVGGTITFGMEKYTVTDGKKESETRTPCPRQVALKSGGEMAGVILRSAPAGAMPQMSARPSFVLIGPRADDFALVRVLGDDKKPVEVPLEGRRFRWPAGVAPLAPETDYELVLIPKAADAPPVKMRFFVSSAKESAGMVLIKVE